jgi:hypothetical protein
VGDNLYFDKDGEPLTLWQWVRKFEDPDYRNVARDIVGDYLVSTVWLGVNYSHTGGKLTFETMVFDTSRQEDDRIVDGYISRYGTLEAAEAGHKWTVDKIRKENELHGRAI